MNAAPAPCQIRLVTEDDLPALESFFQGHEGRSIPAGYFEDFQRTIRSEDVIYLVAEMNGEIVGGGGISNYEPCVQATLTFGIIDLKRCRRGFGTSLLLARLALLDPGTSGCAVYLEATQFSAPFFARLGFTWYGEDVDENGSRFFFGQHVVRPDDSAVLARILRDGGTKIAPELLEISGFSPRSLFMTPEHPTSPPTGTAP